MPTYAIRRGNAPAEVYVGNGTVTNLGPGTIYYSDSQDVTTTFYEGTLPPGGVAGLDGVQWFTTDAPRASLYVLPGAVSATVGPPGPPGHDGATGPAGPGGQAAVEASDAIRGEPGRFYADVACVATFAGALWVPTNDEQSRPHNVDLVTTDSQKIRVAHTTIGATRPVGAPRADAGENLSAVGIRAITRPTKDYTDIILRQDRTIADVLTNPGDGTAWVKEKGDLSELTVSGLENVSGDFAGYTQGLANVAAAWRMSEASGATLDDAIGANDGAVVGSVTYGVTGGLTSDGTDKAITTTGLATSELTFPLAGITQAAFSLFFRFKCPPAATVLFRDHTGSSNRYAIANSGGFLWYQMGDVFFTTTTPWTSVGDSNWHTLGITKNGSAVALYLDGVLVHSANTAGAIGIGTPWHFGRSGNSSIYSAITLSELVTYARALTAQEAKNIHTAAVTDGLLHVSHPSLGNTLASGVSLTSIGDFHPVLVPSSVTETGFSVRFRDVAGADITAADADLAVGIERKVVNRHIDPTAVSVDVRVAKEDTWVNVVASKAPVWWVRLGEPSGSSFNDEIGSNDGTGAGTLTLGAAGYVADDANTAVTFDGAQGKIAFANPGLTGAWSFGCIAKITGAGSVGSSGFGTLLGWGGQTKRLIYDHANGILQAQAGGAIMSTSAAAAPKNAPHVIFFTWDGTTEKWYVDGQLAASVITANITLNAAFWLGSYLGTSVAYSFKGDIDEAMLFDRALGVNDIQELTATAFDIGITADRTTQAQLRFEGVYETAAPPPEPEPDSPVPDPTPLPVGDIGGAVSSNIPLTPYRAQLNADSIERDWVGRVLPATQGARDAIELDGLPTFPDATSTNWKNWWCTNYGVDPTDGHQIANLLGGSTPFYMDAARFPIHVVDEDQPLRNPGVTDQDTTVPGWATETNAAIAAMGGIPIPADARRDFTGDRYVHVYQPSTNGIWSIYAFSPRASGTESATTTMELTGSPSNGGFFLNFDYLDPFSGGTYFSQSSIPYNVTAAALKTIIEGSKLTSGAVLGATRSGKATISVAGGPLNVAPITITWVAALQLRPVPMRATDNFMNAGHVLFTYENADAWTGGNLLGITSPEIANAQQHSRQRIGANGGTAAATGIEFLPMIIDWWEWRAAYDAGIAAGDGTIAGADWDAAGTDMGHVIAMSVGNCGAGSVYPAVRGDGTVNNPTRAIPMQGGLWTLPLTATRPNVITYHFLQPLFNTMQRYGWMWYDKTGGGNTLVFRSWGWPGQVVPFPGPPGMTLSSLNYPIWMRQMPWHQSQIIDPAEVLAGW